jgi:hypothetical protein
MKLTVKSNGETKQYLAAKSDIAKINEILLTNYFAAPKI